MCQLEWSAASGNSNSRSVSAICIISLPITSSWGFSFQFHYPLKHPSPVNHFFTLKPSQGSIAHMALSVGTQLVWAVPCRGNDWEDVFCILVVWVFTFTFWAWNNADSVNRSNCVEWEWFQCFRFISLTVWTLIKMNLSWLDVITVIWVKICVPLRAYKKGDYFKIYLGKWQRKTWMAVTQIGDSNS